MSSGSLFLMFGELLRQARLKAGMTQEELAGKAKLTREYISLIELNKRMPTVVVFIRLTRGVGQLPSEMIQQVEKTLTKR